MSNERILCETQEIKMKFWEKLIMIWIIIIVIVLLMIPMIKIEDECNGEELNNYKYLCEEYKYPRGIFPLLPLDCREYHKETNKVKWLNGKTYQNSCYACRDCQKYFYYEKNVLEATVDKLRNLNIIRSNTWNEK